MLEDHIEHCDVLITGCLANTGHGRALGCEVNLDEDLSALDLVVISETLAVLAGRIGHMAQAKATAN